MSKRRSFVVRVWWDDAGRCQGQIGDPFSTWRRPFHSAEELWYWLCQFRAVDAEKDGDVSSPDPMQKEMPE